MKVVETSPFYKCSIYKQMLALPIPCLTQQLRKHRIIHYKSLPVFNNTYDTVRTFASKHWRREIDFNDLTRYPCKENTKKDKHTKVVNTIIW